LKIVLLEEQSGFTTGRSYIDPSFYVTLIDGKSREFNSETHLAFVDYENVIDKVRSYFV